LTITGIKFSTVTGAEEALEAAAAKDSKATPKASAKAKAKAKAQVKAKAKVGPRHWAMRIS
jgi:hypothetical protein